MEPLRPSQHRRISGLAATVAAAAATANPTCTPSRPDEATTSSYSGKEKRERENEKERTKLRKRNRRAFTRRLLTGLRLYGNFHLSERSNMNGVLVALAREAGWTVEADGTTYRHSPTPQNQQNLRVVSATSGERPLSTKSLKKCYVKGTLDYQPPAVRIDDSGMSPSQGGNYRIERLPLVEATPAL